MELLSRHEELVLLAVWKLEEEAYGAAIRSYLTDVTDEDWSIASVYAPLDRLAARGYLQRYQGPPTAERGGRGKRLYRLTAEGVAALDRVRQIQAVLWSGLPGLGLA
jgi:DNA-binding PadR family transcriptional regulator